MYTIIHKHTIFNLPKDDRHNNHTSLVISRAPISLSPANLMWMMPLLFIGELADMGTWNSLQASFEFFSPITGVLEVILTSVACYTLVMYCYTQRNQWPDVTVPFLFKRYKLFTQLARLARVFILGWCRLRSRCSPYCSKTLFTTGRS